jgi:translation initiation factor IF-3
MNYKKKQHRINQEIRHQTVRVTEGGIMSIADALSLAKSKELDLVLISESANPPVCKIVSYEKMLYELSKKPKNKSLEVKQIQLGPNMAENDLEYRVKHAIEFLDKGHSVRLSMLFKGREMAHVNNGKAVMLKFILAVEGHGLAEGMPTMEGKKMFCTLRPKGK